MKLPIASLDGVTTERLRFREPVVEDAAWWMEYINDAKAIRFMPFTMGSEADCAMFIRRALERIVSDGSGLHAVIEQATGKPVGMIGLLTQMVDGADELEIGYHLLPSAWGNGYATEGRYCVQGVRAPAQDESFRDLLGRSREFREPGRCETKWHGIREGHCSPWRTGDGLACSHMTLVSGRA